LGFWDIPNQLILILKSKNKKVDYDIF